jgi:dihydroorotate dehydrogenase
MSLFPLLRPLIHALDGENAHLATINLLRLVPFLRAPAPDPMLATRVAGLSLPGPVGLAAGFDKDGKVPERMLALGFGFVEVGTLTPLPQQGNPKPRLFRLAEDRAVINRMGFNNGGQEAAAVRLADARKLGIVGINIGANKDSADRIADYAKGVARMAPLASYITINISSPNTPGLRALQDKGALAELLAGSRAAMPERGPPLFLKVAPDLEPEDIKDIVAVSSGVVDALIISNTTISRPPLRSSASGESGGLSGAPLRALAHQRLRDFRAETGGTMPLIGAGGIASADDAYARIRAGASAVQLYSALVYEGPGLASRINAGLVELLKRDGFASISEAVGVDA